jgi:hypothetical protein
MRALYELVYGPDPEEAVFYDKARKAAAGLMRTWAHYEVGYINVWLEEEGADGHTVFNFVERWLPDGVDDWMRRRRVQKMQMCDGLLDEASRECIRVVRASPPEVPAPTPSIPIPAPGTLMKARVAPVASPALNDYARTWPPAQLEASPASPSCDIPLRATLSPSYSLGSGS